MNTIEVKDKVLEILTKPMDNDIVPMANGMTKRKQSKKREHNVNYVPFFCFQLQSKRVKMEHNLLIWFNQKWNIILTKKFCGTKSFQKRNLYNV